eukprot:gb/GECG01014503.1/.p1 GENE.gb/GECG01014503.1/~~gb/GECG01014503.1/.p1  ORF type:complete len:292 (+),score=45.34 gb/GECG01014503.1/:1-876(+)
MEEFFESEHFTHIQPIGESAKMLRGLRDKCRFVVVTSRRTSLEEKTRNWLDTHYEGIFEDVLFANHYASDGSAPTTKSELCKSVGAKVLVDDSLAYIKEASAHVTTVILYGDYSWNKITQDDYLPANAKRAHNWKGLAAILHQLNEDGSVQQRDAIIVTNQKTATFFADSARRTLENQDKVSITSVGPSISTAAEAIELLQRGSEIEVESFRTGTDAAAPNVDRQVRLTAVLKATSLLRQKLIDQANNAALRNRQYSRVGKEYSSQQQYNTHQDSSQQKIAQHTPVAQTAV